MLGAREVPETAVAALARPSCLKRLRRDKALRALESSVSLGIVPSPTLFSQIGLNRLDVDLLCLRVDYQNTPYAVI